MGVKLGHHQLQAIEDLSNGKILCGGVGSGKSRTAIGYFVLKVVDGGVKLNGEGSYTAPKNPRPLYIITTAKKRDSFEWEEELAPFGLSTSDELGLPVIVDSWNNIKKYENTEGCFFIFDEQRLVGSGAWVRSFHKIARRNQWLILSATPGDSWFDYIPVFVANGYYTNRTEFKREHVIYNRAVKFPKVERILGERRLNQLRDEILVQMPLERLTVRHIEYLKTEYDRKQFKEVIKTRWNPFEDRPVENAPELFYLMRKISNQNETRLERLKELWDRHPKLIVFYNFNYELEMMREFFEIEQTKNFKNYGGKPQAPVETLSSQISKHSLTTTQQSSECEKLSLTSTGPTSACATIQQSPGSETSTSLAQIAEQNDTGISSIITDPNTWPNSTITESGSTKDTGNTPASASDSGSTFHHGRNSVGFVDANGQSCQMAEYNGHKHEPVPQSDRWLYLVQYTSGSEAWNCIETDAMVFFSLNYSYKVFEQCLGRIDRMNTPYVDLWYYVLRSDSPLDCAILRSLRAKKKFNERGFDVKKWANGQ